MVAFESSLLESMNAEQINDHFGSIKPKDADEFVALATDFELRKVLSILENDEISVLISKLSDSKLTKLIDCSSRQVLGKILNNPSDELIKRLLLLPSVPIRRRVLKGLPVKQKEKWKDYTEHKARIGSFIENASSRDSLLELEKDRLTTIAKLDAVIEQRQRLLEDKSKQHEHLHEELEIHAMAQEERIARRRTELQELDNELFDRKEHFNEEISKLQKEHQEQLQNRIELKVPQFVSSAVTALEEKESSFSEKSKEWNKYGIIALVLAVAAAFISFLYGGYAFLYLTDSREIDWLFFIFLLFKGLVIIGLLGAGAKHCFTIANSYMHESLKRSDRVHAINFGKLFLEVYGNDVKQEQMLDIFSNWNIEAESAFLKSNPSSFDPKVMENMKDMISAVSKISRDGGQR